MRFLLPACFFLSGLSGLAYETLWTRLISRSIGGSAYAVAIILTAFMGGLGLGAFLAGRRADRLEPDRLVRAYGLLELAAGLSAALVGPAFFALRPVFA